MKRAPRIGGVLLAMLGLLSIALAVAGAVYAARNSRLIGAEIDWTGLVWFLWPAAFVAVGALIAIAQPGILVGWGLLTAGLGAELVGFGGAYGGWASLSGTPAPLSGLATWIGMVAGGVAVAAVPLVVVRLPSGRPDTPIARLVSRVSWALGAAFVSWWAFGNELLSINTMSEDAAPGADLANPLALVHPGRPLTFRITTVLTLGLLACFAWAIFIVLARRRRASAVERAQLRSLGFGLMAVPLGAAVLSLLDLAVPLRPSAADTAFVVVLVACLTAIPVSIAVSVLKYRLFEIGRLISRTVVFGLVGLAVGAVYAALTVLPSLLVAGTGPRETPSWLVAASTLAAAAMFSPLRRGVQRAVDRRFNRSRYDAEVVIAGFAAAVRRHTDVDSISSGLGFAVSGALQPALVSVWVRDP